MLLTAELVGVPEVTRKLDSMQQAVAGPIARQALAAGGEVLRAQAFANVRKLTGTLAADIIVQTRVFQNNYESYALIGPGWDPMNFRRMTQSARSRGAVPDQTTNPAIYGYFLEVGHRAPGKGLQHNLEYQSAARASRRRGQLLNTYTTPSSRDYGHLSTPAYPWLRPAADQAGDAALDAVSMEIRAGLGRFWGSTEDLTAIDMAA